MKDCHCNNGWIPSKYINAPNGVQLPCEIHWPEELGLPRVGIDPIVKQRLRETDTPEKVAARMRRLRERQKRKQPYPVTTPVTQNEGGNGKPRPYAKIAWRAGQRTCRWCHQTVQKTRAEGHHILPRDKGGTDEASNIALVHADKCHDKLEGLTLIVGREPTREEVDNARENFG